MTSKTLPTLVLASLLGFACERIYHKPVNRQEAIKAFCAHLIECYPKGSYGGCVMSATQSDTGTAFELNKTEELTDMSCNELDLTLTKNGVNIAALK